MSSIIYFVAVVHIIFISANLLCRLTVKMYGYGCLTMCFVAVSF